MQGLHHLPELVDVAPGEVARIRREEGDRVVAPVVRQAQVDQPALVVEGLDRQQFHRRDAERLQVRDGRFTGQAQEGSAMRLRHFRHLPREAAHVHFVEHAVFHRDRRVPVALPVEAGVDDHALGRLPGVVFGVHLQVAPFLAQRVGVLPGRAAQGPIQGPSRRDPSSSLVAVCSASTC
jgi:hypothetical protein